MVRIFTMNSPKFPVFYWFIGICLTLLVSNYTLAQDLKPLLLKTPSAFPSHLPALGTPINYISDQLALISNGAIRMKHYEPNKLVAGFEILDAVSSGKLNSGYAAAGFWVGKMPAAPLFSSVPFGPGVGEYLAWFYQGDGLKLYQKMYDLYGFKVKPLPCAVLSAESAGWYTQPVDRAEDFEGLSIRFYGLGARVVEKLGASPTLLPAGELFGAMEKGAVDAAEFSMPAIDYRLGLYKVAKYNYFPSWHQQATFLELLINRDTWEQMSPSQQATIETVCRASIVNSLAEGEALQHQFLKKYRDQHQVELREWDPKMLQTFKDKWQEVIAEERRRDPFFSEVWDNLAAFRKDYALWKTKAFLPLDY